MPHSIFSPTHGTRRHRQPHPEQTEQEPFFSRTAEGGVEPAHTPFFQPAIQTKPREEERDTIQEKTETGGKSEHIQRAPIAEPPSPPATPGEAPAADAGQTATPVQDAAAAPEMNGRFIVEDGQTPGPEQMRKTDFLRRLNEETCQTANQAMAGTPFSTDSCPYIRNAFARHQNSSPVQIERLLVRYEPLLQTAQSLEAYFQIFKAKVNSVVSNWVSTGDISGVPEDIAAQIPESVRLAAGAARGLGSAVSAVSSGIGSVVSGISSAVSSIGSLFFKARPGGAHATQSPLAVMQSLGKGSPMEGGTRSKMEGAFGTNFSEVEVHTDSKAAGLSDGMNAKAFTVGNHVAFGSGEHRPGTLEGDALMAHELAHVEQQRGGNIATGGANSVSEEADVNQSILQSASFSGSNYTGLEVGKKSKIQPKIKTNIKLHRCSNSEAPNQTKESSTDQTKDETKSVPDAGSDESAKMKSDIEKVKSLTLLERKARLQDELDIVAGRFKKRNEHLQSKLALVKGEEKKVVQEMLDKSAIWSKGIDEKTISVTDIDSITKEETEALGRLKRNKNTDDVVKKFIESLKQAKTTMTETTEEETEYKRFDKHFLDAAVVELAKKIPHATITPADLKALVSQETGDLTNTEVAGIQGKTKGVKSQRKNKGGYVGLGQLNTAARDEAITWAKGQKSAISIAEGTDARKDPLTAIKLTAAYLGRVSDLLWGGLPDNRPGEAEFKKMLFAAYNGGHVVIINAAKAYTAGSKKNYSWDDIKGLMKWENSSTHKKLTEIRNYVDNIQKRVSEV